MLWQAQIFLSFGTWTRCELLASRPVSASLAKSAEQSICHHTRHVAYVVHRFNGLEGYATKPAAFFKRMASRESLDGLYPNCFERPSGLITFGADGDSFYECAQFLLPIATAPTKVSLV